jgi:hypothetical protein
MIGVSTFSFPSRHERDQSFLVPVPARKKFRPGPGEKKILVPVLTPVPPGPGPGPLCPSLFPSVPSEQNGDAAHITFSSIL